MGWLVERSLAWLNRCRRLAKDWENLKVKARAFLLLASIRLMVRRQPTAAAVCPTVRMTPGERTNNWPTTGNLRQTISTS